MEREPAIMACIPIPSNNSVIKPDNYITKPICLVDNALFPISGLTIVSDPQSALKIGFELAGDLGKLSSSYPGMSAFTHVDSVLDLRHLWVASLELKFGANGHVSLGRNCTCPQLTFLDVEHDSL